MGIEIVHFLPADEMMGLRDVSHYPLVIQMLHESEPPNKFVFALLFSLDPQILVRLFFAGLSYYSDLSMLFNPQVSGRIVGVGMKWL